MQKSWARHSKALKLKTGLLMGGTHDACKGWPPSILQIVSRGREPTLPELGLVSTHTGASPLIPRPTERILSATDSTAQTPFLAPGGQCVATA